MHSDQLLRTLVCLFSVSALLQDVSAEGRFDAYNYLKRPYKVKAFGEGQPVYGVYRLKEKVYVARDSTPHVEVYSSQNDHALVENLTVTGLQGPYDMVANDRYRTLFLTDWFDAANVTTQSFKVVTEAKRFSLNEPFTVVGLAATTSPSDPADVIATCAQTQKIKEFTKTGELVSEVSFNITQPRHAVKAARGGGGYVVCHGYGASPELHRVCRVSGSGAVGKCFGSVAGSGSKHLSVPSRVLEDGDGNILVADRDNKRVVLLSPTLDYIRDIVTAKDGLVGPYRIFLFGSLLYVADNTLEFEPYEHAVSGRMYVFRVKNE